MLVARDALEAQLLQRGDGAGVDERAGVLDYLLQLPAAAFEFGLQGGELFFYAFEFFVYGFNVGIEAIDKLLLFLNLCGKRELPMHHFITLAKYYNVSLDYLAGLVVAPKKLY